MNLPPAQDGIYYRPIEGFPGYAVGTDGSVWTCKEFDAQSCGSRLSNNWKRMQPRAINEFDHQRVTLRRNDGKGYYLRVHRLIAAAFIPGVGRIVRHLDGKGGCNNVGNLAWGTQGQNLTDRTQHGTWGGEKCPFAVLTEKIVREARAKHRAGQSPASIAREYNVNYGTMYSALRGDNWKQVVA